MLEQFACDDDIELIEVIGRCVRVDQLVMDTESPAEVEVRLVDVHPDYFGVYTTRMCSAEVADATSTTANVQDPLAREIWQLASSVSIDLRGMLGHTGFLGKQALQPDCSSSGSRNGTSDTHLIETLNGACPAQRERSLRKHVPSEVVILASD
jgi:hypothetical protein